MRERELAELEEMLRALEEGRTMRAEDRQRQQQRQRGQQQMGVVQDMVQRQSEMLDRSHQRAEQGERDRDQRAGSSAASRTSRWPQRAAAASRAARRRRPAGAAADPAGWPRCSAPCAGRWAS